MDSYIAFYVYRMYNDEKRIFRVAEKYGKDKRMSDVKIQIDEQVKDFLREKNQNVLTVDLEIPQSCCVQGAFPHVKLMTPEELEKYDKFKQDGITIYLYKGAVIKHTLRFSLINYLLFKEIEVSGIQII